MSSDNNQSPVGPGILHQLETLIQKTKNYEEKIQIAKASLAEIKREFPDTRSLVNRALMQLCSCEICEDR